MQSIENDAGQGKFVQRAETRKPNKTGLPDGLKSGVENLSGMSLDNVKVHYNSSKPAAVQAHAYAQGSDIHLGPSQEKHLPHEAWHVVQQAQGRVKPTTQVNGVSVNDNAGLEKEADVMGARAIATKLPTKEVSNEGIQGGARQLRADVIQCTRDNLELELATEHYGDHFDAELPTTGAQLLQYVRDNWDRFVQDDAPYDQWWQLELGTYETSRANGTTSDRQWSISLKEVSGGRTLVKHFGPHG
ncbi:DUF4157 domain-containing protein [Yoonia sp. BS5-3]|uniref:DUF4157 domain-containing protein n=1 Tax=Yoonia phaeophyticola TaxID=3137369 RepID=A0ABZ3IE53_9RHOB